MTYRNARLLALAKGAPCLAAIPGICNGNPETVVAAHSNWQEHGKGVGHKVADCYICFACEACHSAIDHRTQRLEKDDRRYYWQRGFERTLLYLFETGKLKVTK